VKGKFGKKSPTLFTPPFSSVVGVSNNGPSKLNVEEKFHIEFILEWTNFKLQ
jgi:hypothetical protein